MTIKKLTIVLLLAMTAGVAQAADDAGPAPALQQLREQANFWIARHRPDLAKDALQRILAIHPDDPEALYRMAKLNLGHDRAAARLWTEKLGRAAPDSQHYRELTIALRREQNGNSLLDKARDLARTGQSAAAVKTYRKLFGGDVPPDDLALEYYQTLAGVDGQWSSARNGLRRWVAGHPKDRHGKLALAKVLTYHPQTRREGISQLRTLDASNLAGATKAWREALQWMSPGPSLTPLLDQFLAVHPDDRVIRSLRTQSAGNGKADDLRKGYGELNQGHAKAAGNRFQKAVKADPDNADAIAGLGMVALHEGHFAAAEKHLQHAMQLAPDKAGQWRQARDDARFYGKLAAARKLRDEGNLNQAFQQVLPLAKEKGDHGRDARLLQGDILLRQDRPWVAETVYRDMLTDRPDDDKARVGLIRALIARKHYPQAEQAFRKLPPETRQRYAWLFDAQIENLRDDAKRLINAGNVQAGEQQLQQALMLAPDNPWVRVDLARLADGRGDPVSANRLLAPLTGLHASSGQLSAAALYAGERQNWRQVQALLRRIPEAQRDDALKALAKRAQAGQAVASLRAAFDSGDRWRLHAALDNLHDQPPRDPATLGQVARLLVERGEDKLALVLVRRDLDQGIHGDVAAYVPYVSVLARCGYSREASRLLSDLQYHAASQGNDDKDSAKALLAARLELTAIHVNQLRQQGKLAQAYDEAVVALDRQPDNPPLLMALGRLYQQGKFHQQADAVYQWLLDRPGEHLDARRAAVANALAAGDNQRAEKLLQEAAPLHDSELLLLAARAARSEGDKRDALALTRQAGNALRRTNGNGAPQALLDNPNPFRDSKVEASQSRWAALTGNGLADADQDGNVKLWLPGGQQRSASGAIPDHLAGSWQPLAASDYRYLARPYHQASAPLRPVARSSPTAPRTQLAATAPPQARLSPGAPTEQQYRSRTVAAEPASGTVERIAYLPGERQPAPSDEVIQREKRIGQLQDQLTHELAPWMSGGLALRYRDGESGLSELTEVNGTLGGSMVPLQSGRIKLSVSPVFLNAGTLEGDAWQRFGSGPLVLGARTLSRDLGNVSGILGQTDRVADNYRQTQLALASAQSTSGAATAQLTQAQADLAALQADSTATTAQLAQAQNAVTQAQASSDAADLHLADSQAKADQAATGFHDLAQRNVLYESGIDLDALSASDRAFVDRYLQQQFGSSDFSLDASSWAAYQTSRDRVAALADSLQQQLLAYSRASASSNLDDAGLGLDFSYQQGDLSADIGSTPMGFEYHNLIGGVSWAPALGRSSRLMLTAERRAVKDSLLSYAGVEDPLTGERWGAVTRSGASLGLAFDNGGAGLYGKVGYYGYQGHGVADNRAWLVNLGGYLRPINESERVLQAGVNVDYRAFDENLSKFTYGHGGYFSPQDYVSVSFPLIYKQTHGSLTWTAQVAPGFQSWNLDAADYFPTRGEQQRLMDILAAAKVLPSSGYAAESESGFGLNLSAGLEYRLSRDLSLGSHIGYDTFGDYSETLALINLNYTMEP